MEFVFNVIFMKFLFVLDLYCLCNVLRLLNSSIKKYNCDALLQYSACVGAICLFKNSIIPVGSLCNKVTQLKCSQSPIPSQLICYVNTNFLWSFECRIRAFILSWSTSSHLLQNWWTSAYQCIPESSQHNISLHHCSKPGNYVSLLARKTVADS